MAGTHGHADRELKRRQFLEALAADPQRHDFFRVLRRIEALYPEKPRLGEGRRPAAEPIRLAQEASLTFAPSNLSRVQLGTDGVARLFFRFLGLFGPQGALPTHLTEFARDRERQHADPTFARFVDLFHHRQMLQFYRAWRQAQPTASRDRPGEDRFATYVGALIGHGTPASLKDPVGSDPARRYFAGHLNRGVRHADGLASILAEDLDLPVAIRPFVARWLRLPVSEQSALGAPGIGNAALGRSAVIGSRVLDVQHHADIAVGPIDYASYRQLMPGGAWHRRIGDWARDYLNDEIGLRIVPRLRADDVPRARLGAGTRLGRDAWIGTRRSPASAEDLAIAVSRPAVG